MAHHARGNVGDIDLRGAYDGARTIGDSSQNRTVRAALAIEQACRNDEEQTYSENEMVDFHGRISSCVPWTLSGLHGPNKDFRLSFPHPSDWPHFSERR